MPSPRLELQTLAGYSAVAYHVPVCWRLDFSLTPLYLHIQCVPLATEPDISLIILPLMRILQRNLKRTTDTFLFISHTTNVLLFKFRCNIFIGVRIIKNMPGSVVTGTHCIIDHMYASTHARCSGTYSDSYVCHGLSVLCSIISNHVGHTYCECNPRNVSVCTLNTQNNVFRM